MQRWVSGGILVVFGVVAALGFRYIQVIRTLPFAPQPSTFTLEPPAQAITGALAVAQGKVEQLTREADDFQEATPGSTIRQGESIATKDGLAMITLGNLGGITMKKNSEISFVNLVPASIMFRQKSGTTTYEVNSFTPFSIHALHALMTLSGDAILTIDDTDITFRVTKGTAKLALVDNDNNTNVWGIVQGQRALVDDEKRTVILGK